MHKRGTILSLEQNLQIGNTTTYRELRKGLIKKVITHVKPSLNPKQKIERLDFCIKHIELPCFQFFSFNNTIHIDEKRFQIQKTNQKMYLAPEETIPIRKCQNKRFMRKVMFLVAVAKPRRNYRTKKFLDGKLGCFPLTKQIM